jgi:hypothetical protein
MIKNFKKFRKDLEILKKNYKNKIILPDFSNNIDSKLINNINIRDGYQRGWGIQRSKYSKFYSGDLVKQVQEDKLYKFALSAMGNISKNIMIEENRINIFLIITKYLQNIENSDWIEFGSYKGSNLIFLSILSKVLGFGNKIFGCDSFDGMPKTNKILELHNKGDFNDTDLKFLENYANKLGLDNLVLIKGFFKYSLKKKEMKKLKFSFSYIDCDLYESCNDAFKYLKNKLVPKGYFVFDDANQSSCLGATRFVEDIVIRKYRFNCEQIYPQFVFRNKN